MENALLKRIAEAAGAVPPPGFGMVGAAMVQLMGGKVDASVLSGVLEAAGVLGEVSENSAGESRGLLVSEMDLQDIFRYVDEALSLPATVTAAEEYLGYKSGDDFFQEDDHKFLLPERQVEFDKPIIAHAERWAGIEMSVKSQGNVLDQYAREFVTRADGVLEVLEDLSKYMKVHGFLDEGGKEIVEGGAELLAAWERDTARRREETESLQKILEEFSRDLENTIRPSVEARRETISGLNLTEEIADLAEEVKGLKDRISKLQKEYDEYTGLAFTGAAGLVVPVPYLGIVAWAATGGVFGAKAEKARKEKGKAKAELASKQKQMDADNRIAGGIQRLEMMMADFQGAVRTAITGVQHMNVVWDSIVKDVKNAQNNILNILDPEYVTLVMTLMTEIRLARSSWASCGSIARELVVRFDEARAHYRK